MTIRQSLDATPVIPFTTIEEITKIGDRERIEKVWNKLSASIKDSATLLSTVVDTLLDQNSSAEATDYERSVSMETQTEGDKLEKANQMAVTDTSAVNDSENDDIQKAIAASLQDAGGNRSILGGNFSREDQEISRVLEESYAENKTSQTQSTSTWLFDPANPFERIRQANCPVGLKNIGNTCWFNAVVQSLFHIEQFRSLVINYEPSEEFKKENQVYIFMVELRKLFALLLASNRKYVNPSSVIEILRQAFHTQSHGVHGQQDVSEFQHKLLDWLEEAFKHQQSTIHEKSKQKPPEQQSKTEAMETDEIIEEKDDNNDMVKLFYGKVKTYGTNAGKRYTTHTHFGQWPLYIAGYSDVHESLEAGLVQGEIETNDPTQTTSQEQWFTRLPPVLTFELSRLSYNKQLTQAEKLHNKFSFPQFLYLDRYMDINKDEIREKRDKVRRLNNDLKALQQTLLSYTQYGSGERKYPLVDVLDCSLQFAKAGKISERSNEQTPEKLCSQAINQPCPNSISQEELIILSNCLLRWKNEVRNRVEEYEKQINGLKCDISQTYEQENLKKFRYDLHAVMVHEGEAISGHYWSYVYNVRGKSWLKFNDISVSPSSWIEVVKESEGGMGTASAYCLIYLRNTDLLSAQGTPDQTNQNLSQPSDSITLSPSIDNLPESLKSFVESDNQRLEHEKEKWLIDTKPVMPSDDSESVPQSYAGITTELDELATSHAQTILQIISKIYESLEKLPPMSPVEILDQLISQLINKYMAAVSKFEMTPQSEIRVHLGIFLLCVYGESLKVEDLAAIIADQIARLEGIDLNKWSYVRNEANRRARKHYASHIDFQANYLKWHSDCHQFRTVLALFCYGCRELFDNKYDGALTYFQIAFEKNESLIRHATQNEKATMKAMDSCTLSELRKECLQRCNQAALHKFKRDANFKLALKLVLEYMLPILDVLQLSDNASDGNLVTAIKNTWICLLNEELDPARAEALNDFLTQLFEPAITVLPQLDNVAVPMNIFSMYKETVKELSSLFNLH